MQMSVLPAVVTAQSLTPTASGAGARVLDTPVDLAATIKAASGNTSPAIVDPFWLDPDVELSRWSKLFPYQLLVVRARKAADGSTTYSPEPGWSFTLPVPPESLKIKDLFGISVAATLGGVDEQHNGIPFVMIQVHGTFGVLPGKGAAPQQLGLNAGQAIFAGTTTALGGVFQTIAPIANPNVHSELEFDDALRTDNSGAGVLAKTTGYNQWRTLQKFFRAYTTVKTTKAGTNLHLAWASWKDQAVYLVTPIDFEVSKTASSPLEYTYDMVLQAWRQVSLNASVFEVDLGTPIRRDPNALARLLNIIQTSRRVLQGLTAAAVAVVGDVDRLIFEPLRESALLVKDFLGLNTTLADLPDTLKQRLKESWVQSQGDANAVNSAASRLAASTNHRVKQVLELGRSAANETRDSVTRAGRKFAAAAATSHPVQDAFAHPSSNFDFHEQQDLASIQMPAAVLQAVAAERARVQGLRREDWEARRAAAAQAEAALTVALGAGDATYDDTFGVVARPLKMTPTDSDWEALFALNDAAMALDSLAATGDDEPSSRLSSIEVMAGLARRSGIAFTVPVSKFAVPFPYGCTLEALAQQYLGDASRWHEIAALNGLRSPYVDETGFDLPLLVRGSGNQVVVQAPQDNLFVGQVAYVASGAFSRSRRLVQGIETIGTSLVVTLDGPANLHELRVEDNAVLSAFLPDTVNSQGLVYIPSSEEPADDSWVTRSIPGVMEFDPMVAAGGVDWLLDSNNDLIVTPDGDTRLAIGLTNILQSGRVAMSVRQGTLLGHPSYGLPVEVGSSTADFSAKSVLQAVRRMFAADPTFSSVTGVSVRVDAHAVQVAANLQVSGTRKTVPVRYAVRTDAQTA